MYRTLVISLVLCGYSALCPASAGEAEDQNKKIPEALVTHASRYFKVRLRQVDPHLLCAGPGNHGVYRVYNRTMKGAGAVFIYDAEGVVAPGEPGYGFDRAAVACRLAGRLPNDALLAARLYLLFAPERRIYGMVVEDPARFRAALNAREIELPSAKTTKDGFILIFWTRNINTNAFYRLEVHIPREGKAALRAAEKKRFDSDGGRG